MKLNAPTAKQSHIAQIPYTEYVPWHWQISGFQSVQNINALGQNKNIMESPHFGWCLAGPQYNGWMNLIYGYDEGLFWSMLSWEDNVSVNFPQVNFESHFPDYILTIGMVW